MKTFQQPLSSDEEAFYINIMQQAKDPQAVLEARNILVERNLRLVAHIAKKYQSVDENMEEMISVGTIGLIKAVSSFDSAKGNKLATYAARCIDNELLMMFRARKKISREVSLFEPIGTDREGNEISLLDIVESGQPEIDAELENAEKRSKLLQMIRERLTPREREIICMRYGLYNRDEMTQKDVGRVLGISRSYVSRIEKRALQKLKDGFEGTLYRE